MPKLVTTLLFYFFLPGMHTPSPTDGTYTGSDHTYVIYDPRADSLEDWDNWNLICRVKILS